MPVTPAIALPVSMERTRPLPIRWTEDIEHLDGATRGELRIPRCTSCGREFWPAGPVCPFDFSADVDWVTDPGDGVVNSWVRVHRPYFEGDDVPYVVVQIQLASGPRLTTSWTGTDTPIIGEPVSASFREVGPGVWLPEFGSLPA